MALEPGLENILVQALSARGEKSVGLEPGLAERMVRDTVDAVDRQSQAGLPAVLMVPPTIRTLMSRFLRRSAPNLRIISHSEVPDGKSIKVTQVIGQAA
jgi:flagellar biosynthesis protein FlhA